MFISNSQQDIATPSNNNFENEKKANSHDEVEEPIKIVVDFDDENGEKENLAFEVNDKIDEIKHDENLQIEDINKPVDDKLQYEALNPNETPIIYD